MELRELVVVGLLSLVVGTPQGSRVQPDAPIVCDLCPSWNAPREPFRVYGNTYYVGVGGLSAVLITSDAGHVLLDGDLPQSAAIVDAHIRQLGFRTEDIRLILSSHPHFDHVGGIAALQRASGAAVVASAANARALEQGGPTSDDPQYALVGRFPPVSKVRVVADGDALRVGGLVVTAHLTPGHTPGGTTWTWRSCVDPRCLDIVYADSLNPVSAPGFRFTGNSQHPSLVETFRRSIATVAALPCDILLSVHPEFSDMNRKLENRARAAEPDPFIDAGACRAYAATASAALDRRIADER